MTRSRDALKAQGKREALLLLLRQRFGRLPAAAASTIGKVGAAELDVWFKRGLTASSLAAIGMLLGTARRGGRMIEEHVALVGTARAIEAGLPGRGQPFRDRMARGVTGLGTGPWRIGARACSVQRPPPAITFASPPRL